MMEKLYDSENNIRGYRLGEYYLLKYYAWNGKCNWYIAKEDKYYCFACERDKAVETGKLELVESFQKGRERILELANI